MLNEGFKVGLILEVFIEMIGGIPRHLFDKGDAPGAGLLLMAVKDAGVLARQIEIHPRLKGKVVLEIFRLIKIFAQNEFQVAQLGVGAVEGVRRNEFQPAAVVVRADPERRASARLQIVVVGPEPPFLLIFFGRRQLPHGTGQLL